jgi:cellulose synthase operon protein C
VADGESELRLALTINSGYVPAYLNLARSLLDRGRAQDAVDLLATGTRLVPQEADLQTLLGEAYLRLGQKDDAVAAFERSLSLRPGQNEVRQRLKALGSDASAGGAPPGGVAPEPP